MKAYIGMHESARNDPDGTKTTDPDGRAGGVVPPHKRLEFRIDRIRRYYIGRPSDGSPGLGEGLDRQMSRSAARR